MLLHLCQKPVEHIYVDLFLGSIYFCSVPFRYMSVSLPVTQNIDYYSYISLEISRLIPSTLFFFLKLVVFFLSFHMKFRIISCIFTKTSCWDFDGNSIKCVYQFGNNCYLYPVESSNPSTCSSFIWIFDFFYRYNFQHINLIHVLSDLYLLFSVIVNSIVFFNSIVF